MRKRIFDRQNRTYYTEKQFMAKELRFLYENVLGRFLVNAVISRRWFSRLYTYKYYRKSSAGKIDAFIREHNIDMTEYPEQSYQSFNDFFTRSLLPEKRPFPSEASLLAAPADAKLSAFPITDSLAFVVKGCEYTLASLFRDENLAARYSGGLGLLFRLSVDDYHHYCFIDDGEVLGQKEIPGRLHTVGPFADGRHSVLAENHRIVTVMRTRRFGVVSYVEVGALLVGGIHNQTLRSFRRGQEKGYFAYGGSSILVVLPEGTAAIDEDILRHSEKGTEVKVRMGERIGKALEEKEYDPKR